jgi:pyruvate dehydrogenase E2 component (dihydrolipoamide acetyltransferase)
MSNSIHAITMPRWGMTMTEGQLVKWLVQVGEPVTIGQEILEIETEKIANVLEATAAGTLRRQLVTEQSVAMVGNLLGVISNGQADEADIDAFVAAFADRQQSTGDAESSGPAARSVEIDGGSINVLSMGDGAAVPAVFIHGFGGDLNSWLFNHPDIAASRPAHALDLPAHGASSIPRTAMTVENLADAVLSALDRLGVQRCHIVAHSLGAAMALLIARDHPSRVASLSLVSPVGLGPGINNQYIRDFLGAERRAQMSKALSTLFADPSQVRREMADDVLRFMRTDGVPAALRALAEDAFPDGRQRLTLREVIGTGKVPVQIIWGEADRIIPSGHAAGLESSAKVHVLPGVGHMAYLEQAGRVNELLTQFMATIDASQSKEK